MVKVLRDDRTLGKEGRKEEAQDGCGLDWQHGAGDPCSGPSQIAFSSGSPCPSKEQKAVPPAV